MQWKTEQRVRTWSQTLAEDEMDWSEVTDFVKILSQFNEPLFIEVHGLMDKKLIRSNIEIESVRTTSCCGV